MILALFERLDVTEAEGFDHIHGLVEATKRALRVRDRVVTDPDYLAHPLERLLDARFLAGEAMKIDRRKAARWPLAVRRRRHDLDGRGRRVRASSCPTSSRCTGSSARAACCRRTGVLMQNRGASFSLQSGALNPLMPGRLPFHTLNPALAVLKDGRIMAYGCMGGDGQPQTQSALFTRHVEFREPLVDAIDRPRWVLGRTWGAARTALRLEPRFDGNLIDALAAAGHDVDMLAGGLFRRHGPRRRRGAAPRRHLRRRARSAGRRRRRGRIANQRLRRSDPERSQIIAIDADVFEFRGLQIGIEDSLRLVARRQALRVTSLR